MTRRAPDQAQDAERLQIVRLRFGGPRIGTAPEIDYEDGEMGLPQSHKEGFFSGTDPELTGRPESGPPH
jgi:hypothetical protein